MLSSLDPRPLSKNPAALYKADPQTGLQGPGTGPDTVTGAGAGGNWTPSTDDSCNSEQRKVVQQRAQQQSISSSLTVRETCRS